MHRASFEEGRGGRGGDETGLSLQPGPLPLWGGSRANTDVWKSKSEVSELIHLVQTEGPTNDDSRRLL